MVLIDFGTTRVTGTFMINGKKIVVVVPAYNVEKQIGKAIRQLSESIDHIIIVDDCSKDSTLSEIRKFNGDRIIILENKINQGVGGATKKGFKKGLELKGDIFVKYDGDGQMDPSKINDLIVPLFEGYDYVKGNRFIHAKELTTMPKIRLFGNFILTFFTKLSSGYWNIFDPQNGFSALKREMLELLPLHQLANRYFFENDVLIHLNVLRARVKDIGIPAKYGHEKSSMNLFKIVLSFPWLLMKGFFYRVYHKYILYDFSIIGLFYILGFFLLSFGVTLGAFWWIKSITSGVIATTGTVMIAVLPIILGFQLFLQAIVLEAQSSH